MSLYAGLIGHPVAHSISPVFQQAAFAALGIDAVYKRWDTTAEGLAARIESLRGAGCLGANVTVPHKEAVPALLDGITPLARRAGAVNTISNVAGELRGDNTDVAGFRRALAEAGGYAVAGRRALVLGAGGAARAVVLALEADGARSISISNRHRGRAERLIADLRSDSGPELTVVGWEALQSALGEERADLVVNCTTLGMSGTSAAGVSVLAASWLGRDTFVCDIVANPRHTPLLRTAAAAGCRTLGGLAMLVFQGAAAFEAWTGQPAPVAAMLAAADAAMARLESGG